MFLRVIGVISIFMAAGWGRVEATHAVKTTRWVETTQKDFGDGTFEHNLYVSFGSGPDRTPGDVEFVPRWDYNQDGYGDVTVSTVGQAGPVSLKVLDVAGAVAKIIIDKNLRCGIYKAFWNARDSKGMTLPAGVYFIRLGDADRVCVTRTNLLK